MFDLCVREIPSILFFSVNVNVKKMKKWSMFVLTWRITLHNQRPCLEQGVGTILYQYLATKLLTNSQVRIEFLQFDFEKSLTEETDIKNMNCFLYVSCIYDIFWWVGRVTEVNVHESDLKIEFLNPHGPRKTSSRPSVDDKCFVQAQTFYALSQLQQQSLGKCIRSQALILNKL